MGHRACKKQTDVKDTERCSGQEGEQMRKAAEKAQTDVPASQAGRRQGQIWTLKQVVHESEALDAKFSWNFFGTKMAYYR